MKQKKTLPAGSGPLDATVGKPKPEANVPYREQVWKTWENWVPNGLEIARIAALLAHGRAIGDLDFADRLASEALRLWGACGEQRRRYIADGVAAEIWRTGIDGPEEPMETETMPLPQPRRYPVSFDDFLRLLLHDHSKADRERFFRDFVREQVWRERCRSKAFGERQGSAPGEGHADPRQFFDTEPVPGIADEDVLRSMEAHRKAKLWETDFVTLAEDFLAWRKQNASKNARKAAQARWGAGDGKKALAGPSAGNGGKKP